MTKEENKKLRELIWLKHGCSVASLYSGDGEMSCGYCLLDFKRDSVEDIEARFCQMAMQRFVIEANLNDKEESQSLSITITS